MKKIKLSKRKKTKKSNLIILLLLSIAICIILFLNNVSKRVAPILFETARIEVKNFSTIIMNKSISHALEGKIDTEELFDTVVDKDGKIQMVDFNPVIVNKVLNIATTTVQENIKFLEEGNIDSIISLGINIDNSKIKKLKKGIITEIPMGVVSKNFIISNLGPKIPVRLHYMGDIDSNIKTKITPYGINNALIEVNIELKLNVKIMLPFISKNTSLKYSIPLIIKVIQGSIPNYYGNGLIKDSSLYSSPLE